MHDPSTNSSYRRIFFAVFALALSVFSLLFILLCALPSPNIVSADDVHPTNTAAFAPTAEDALRVLFIGAQTRESTSPLVLLAGFYPDRGSVPLVSFPPNTAVQGSDRAATLAEAWQYGGAPLVRDVLQDTLGIDIDRYVCLDESAFTALTAATGSVEMTLDQPVALLRNGTEMTLQPGIHRLNGQNILDLLHAEQNPADRCDLAAALSAELVNQHMALCLSDAVDDIFFAVINRIDTDMTYNDYDMRKQAAAFLARLGDAPARAITLQGSMGSDGRYHPAAAWTAELGEWFA